MKKRKRKPKSERLVDWLISDERLGDLGFFRILNILQLFRPSISYPFSS